MHLFVDSLVNQDKQSFAFQCTDSSRFKKGICLSCRKNRCNGIGYNARKTRNRRNSKMYLKTRADMPFKGTVSLFKKCKISSLRAGSQTQRWERCRGGRGAASRSSGAAGVSLLLLLGCTAVLWHPWALSSV